MAHCKIRVVEMATRVRGLAPDDVQSRKLSPSPLQRATFPMQVNARTMHCACFPHSPGLSRQPWGRVSFHRPNRLP